MITFNYILTAVISVQMEENKQHFQYIIFFFFFFFFFLISGKVKIEKRFLQFIEKVLTKHVKNGFQSFTILQV